MKQEIEKIKIELSKETSPQMKGMLCTEMAQEQWICGAAQTVAYKMGEAKMCLYCRKAEQMTAAVDESRMCLYCQMAEEMTEVVKEAKLCFYCKYARELKDKIKRARKCKIPGIPAKIDCKIQVEGGELIENAGTDEEDGIQIASPESLESLGPEIRVKPKPGACEVTVKIWCPEEEALDDEDEDTDSDPEPESGLAAQARICKFKWEKTIKVPCCDYEKEGLIDPGVGPERLAELCPLDAPIPGGCYKDVWKVYKDKDGNEIDSIRCLECGKRKFRCCSEEYEEIREGDTADSVEERALVKNNARQIPPANPAVECVGGCYEEINPDGFSSAENTGEGTSGEISIEDRQCGWVCEDSCVIPGVPEFYNRHPDAKYACCVCQYIHGCDDNVIDPNYNECVCSTRTGNSRDPRCDNEPLDKHVGYRSWERAVIISGDVAVRRNQHQATGSDKAICACADCELRSIQDDQLVHQDIVQCRESAFIQDTNVLQT